ncbi:MAG: hypothetical protein OHK0017_00410 [Patescibacteria group bacterium]
MPENQPQPNDNSHLRRMIREANQIRQRFSQPIQLPNVAEPNYSPLLYLMNLTAEMSDKKGVETPRTKLIRISFVTPDSKLGLIKLMVSPAVCESILTNSDTIIETITQNSNNIMMKIKSDNELNSNPVEYNAEAEQYLQKLIQALKQVLSVSGNDRLLFANLWWLLNMI